MLFGATKKNSPKSRNQNIVKHDLRYHIAVPRCRSYSFSCQASRKPAMQEQR